MWLPVLIFLEFLKYRERVYNCRRVRFISVGYMLQMNFLNHGTFFNKNEKSGYIKPKENNGRKKRWKNIMIYSARHTTFPEFDWS